MQSDMLLLADVFENFCNKCIDAYIRANSNADRKWAGSNICIYILDPTHFLSALELAWQAYFKKKEVELELSINFDIAKMEEKGTRGGICQAIHRYAKANNKYMTDHNKDKELSYSMYWVQTNLTERNIRKITCWKSDWEENLSKIGKKFMKIYYENSDI